MSSEPGARDSSTLGLRERKKDQTRQALINCAVTLFEQKGFDATGVDEVAAAAQCSMRTVYRYFSIKEDLVFFDFEDILDTTKRYLDAVPAEADPWEAVTAGLRDRTRLLAPSDPDTAAARIRLWFTDPTLRSRYLELSRPWEDMVGEFLASRTTGLTLEEDLEAQVAAAAIHAALRAAYRNEVLHGRDFDELLDRGFQLLASGVAHHHRVADKVRRAG